MHWSRWARNRLRSCLGIIGLAKRFGAERLEAAALRALEIQARNYPSVKSILEKGLDRIPAPTARSPISAPGRSARTMGYAPGSAGSAVTSGGQSGWPRAACQRCRPTNSAQSGTATRRIS